MSAKFKLPQIKTFHALTNRNIAQRAVFLKKMVDIMQVEADVIFIDQSTFQNFSKKTKMWVLEHYEKPLPFPGRFKSIKLIYACSKSQTIHFKLNDYNTTTYVMIDFLKKMIEKLEKNKY